jgi:hypothetical protein
MAEKQSEIDFIYMLWQLDEIMYAMMCNRLDVSVKYHVGSDALDGAIGNLYIGKQQGLQGRSITIVSVSV